MGKQEIELTAYCGLYCGDCVRYKSKAADLARELLDELQRTEFEKYAEAKSGSMDKAEELEYYQGCCKVLETIVELQCNESCQVGGGCPTFSCKIVECCQEKELEGCWECEEFETCDKFDFLKPVHEDAYLKNLRKIKKQGLDKFIEGKQYW